MYQYEFMNTTGYYLYGGEWFITHPVEIMTPIFLIFFILFVLNFKTILSQFSKVSRNTWAILFLIFLVGFWLRNDEYRYGYGYDGFFYLNSAKYMLEKDVQVWSCAIGNDERCYLYNQHLAPAGYPYLIFLALLLFGVHDIYAMMISGILSSITIILIFLFTYFLFKNERAGLYASSVFALIPFESFISSTGASRPTSIFFIALTMVIYYIALKKDSIKLWSLVAITFSYTLYVRIENVILLFPMVAILFVEGRLKFSTIKKMNWPKFAKKYWIPLAIFLISQIPLQHWQLFSNHYPAGGIFKPTNFPFASYLTIYTFFLNPIFYQIFYNPIVSAIFLLSVFLLYQKRYRNQILVVWVWFLSYFVLHSIHIQCPGFPENLCFDYLRFMQHYHIPYAILAGMVFFSTENLIKAKRDLILVFTFIFIFFTAFLFPSIEEPKMSLFKDGRLDEPRVGDFITLINMTPPDSVLFVSQVIIPNFDYFQGDERNLVDVNVYSSNNYLYTTSLIRDNKDKPMFFIEDYICSSPIYCEFLYDNFEWSLIETKNQIKLMRIEPKKDFT